MTYEDDLRATVLSETAGDNYDCHHPGMRYCGGCTVKINGEDMLADLRERGWDLVELAAQGPSGQGGARWHRDNEARTPETSTSPGADGAKDVTDQIRRQREGDQRRLAELRAYVEGRRDG